MNDDDVTKKAGIYPYLLTGEERHLNIRVFSKVMKQKAFKIQEGVARYARKRLRSRTGVQGYRITPGELDEEGDENNGNYIRKCQCFNEAGAVQPRK